MSGPASDEVSLSPSDLLRAVAEGVVSRADAEALIDWARRGGRAAAPPEQRKGLNVVSVLYYGGALIMIAACAWFLGDKWETLGSRGVLVTTLIYAAIATAVGVTLRRTGWPIAGGLLITVAVCLTPLATYCVEDLLGWWPADPPGKYREYYPLIRASWIVMELATVAVAGVALYFVRFGFLTAPLAFSLWFFSMDLAAYLGGEWWGTLDGRRWVSMAVGLATIASGFAFHRALSRRSDGGREDYAFWCFLFGMLAFWGALTSMDSDSELGKALYALLNIAFIALAVWSRRVTFLVVGGLGVHLYLGHPAFEVFKDSALFPFALMAVGLSLILSAVAAQRFWRARPA
jgi:hypothetical protein